MVPIPPAWGLLSLIPEGVRRVILNLSLMFENQKFVIYRNLAKNNKVLPEVDDTFHSQVRFGSFSLLVGLTMTGLLLPSLALGLGSQYLLIPLWFLEVSRASAFLGFGDLGQGVG